MPPTSTTLFPEQYPDSLTKIYPEIGGYSAEPQPGALASVEVDTGAEQVRKRRDVLMQFRYRTPPIKALDAKVFADFVALVGNGDVNFHFYEPESYKFGALFLGYTDGTSTLKLPFRGLDSWDNLLVDGSTVDYAINNEFYTTKEDRIGWLTVDPPPGQEIVIYNCYGRRRYICRMQSWRRYAYQGGAVAADFFQPAYPTVPLFRQVYEFQFKEKG